MITLGRGEMSGMAGPRQAVARSAGEWQALWRAHAPGTEAPAVDFSREMVAAVWLGMRPTSGYGVEIVGVESAPEGLAVEYRERTPAPGTMTAQVLTSPFHLVTLARRDGAVVFRRVEGA
jgi:hypothetical protein